MYHFLSIRPAWLIRLALAALVLFGMVGLSTLPVAASTITVNSTADTLNAADGQCTLREAIRNANADADLSGGDCAAGSGPDTITLSAGTYILALGGINENDALTGDLDVLNTLSINGAGLSATFIDGNELDRVFHNVGVGSLSLNNLTVRNGNANVSGGGGVLAAGPLTLTNVRLEDNSTTGSGGAVLANTSLTLAGVDVVNNQANVRGGGVYALGITNINASLFQSNQANGTAGTDGGGGVYALANVALTETTFFTNTAFYGGGLYSAVRADMLNVIFDTNASVNSGGGLRALGEVSLVSSAVFGNLSGNPGGGLSVDAGNVIISATNIYNNSANGIGGGVQFGPSGGSLSISNSEIYNNVTTSNGGGLDASGGPVALTNVLVYDNQADFSGGGLRIDNGTLTLNNSRVSNNATLGLSGGGLEVTSDGAAVIVNSTLNNNTSGLDGGGLFSNGAVTLTQSTLSNNAAERFGGGLVNVGTLTALNSTFSGNQATNTGGGLLNQVGANATLTHITVVESPIGRGVVNQGTLTLRNSLIASNSPSDCAGSIISQGSNLDTDDTCSASITSATPGLDVLEPSGATATHALLDGSPALDAALALYCPATDQRGVSRPQGAACDLGAFERETSAVNIFTVSNTNDSGPGSLRQAMLDANATPNTGFGPDEIRFNIPGAGPHTLSPTSSLPSLAEAVIIDGLTQPGASCAAWPPTLRIEVSGAAAGPAVGFNFAPFSANNSVVRGLVVNRFTTGFNLAFASNVRLTCNFIGTDVSGTSALGNTSGGIMIQQDSDNNVIGGPTPSDRNLISGNGGSHISLSSFSPGSSPTGNLIENNYIGTNVSGLSALPNSTFAGVYAYGASGATVRGNVIAGNSNAGVYIAGDASRPSQNHLIWGNRIGVNVADAALGNGGAGIYVVQSQNDVIGGTGPNQANQIAHNTGAGIALGDFGGAPQGISLRGNNIFANGGLGIDLLGDGAVAPNDTGDSDTGPNGLQNYPVLVSAEIADEALRLTGYLNSQEESTYTVDFYANSTCDPSGHGEGQGYLGSTSVSVPSGSTSAYFVTNVPDLGYGPFITAIATDAAGNASEFSACLPIGVDNTSWTKALRLNLSAIDDDVESASIQQALTQLGQARWYKFSVRPGNRVIITLQNLPANYDLVLYGDIAQAFNSILSPTTESLVELHAEFAPDAFTPDAFTPDAFTPDAFTPDAFTPDAFTPDAFTPDAFTPDAFTPDAFTPDAFTPDAFTPDAFTPDAFTPDAFTPDAFTPDAFTPDAFTPDAFTSAQQKSILAVSAFGGNASEGVSVLTWEATGDFYIRVRGREGAFAADQPFDLTVTQIGGQCNGVDPNLLPAETLSASAGGFKTVILTDLARLPGSPADKAALLARLNAFAARPEVAGAVVDVSASPRVAAANALSDPRPQCVYAKNLVAYAINDLVKAYRANNPVQYVLIVGGDEVIPFFRHPDQAMLANERNYVPPVLDNTASQASLRLGYVLSQDRYGASRELLIKDDFLPIPDLPVGRLVETLSDINAMFDAYDLTTNGVVATPTSALVTGYDFLVDAAEATQAELTAGLGVPVNTLITPRDVSPLDPASWNADQLRAALFTTRRDLIYLAGHFNANAALAADYTTRIFASEVVTSAVDFRNVIIVSGGCHSGYNLVNQHGVPNVTLQPDWAQAFASRGATFIGGTGYQYGETILIEYGERLYLTLAQQLRAGTGPVAVGAALVQAKQIYLANTPELRGIHEKTLLQATLFGFPMLAVDMPAGRATPPAPAPSVVVGTEGFASNPGLTLGLRVTEVTVLPNLNLVEYPLTDLSVNEPVTATYATGNNGYVVNPAEPALPLEKRNVSVDNILLRGVGFVGGDYTDLPNILPMVGAATTEIRGVVPPFYSNVFYPTDPWRVNYLSTLTGGPTELMAQAAQYRSNTPGDVRGTLRQYSAMRFRLFYSNNTTTYGGGSVPALSAPPSIVSISGVANGGVAEIQARVTGNPAAGIQEVWVTFTDPTAPAPAWQSVFMTQNASDSTLWEASIPLGGTDPANFQFMVQAVNGVGLVTLSSNQGAYYPLSTGAALPPSPTTLAIINTPTSGLYGTLLNASAELKNAQGLPLANQWVTLSLDGVRRAAQTDAQGRASVTLPLVGLPSTYRLQASFTGAAGLSPAQAETSFSVLPASTTLTAAPAEQTVFLNTSATYTFTLRDTAGRALTSQTVFVLVGDQAYPLITNFIGQAVLTLNALPEGTYTVTASFGADVLLPGQSQPVRLSDARYAPTFASARLTVLSGDVTPPVSTLTVAGSSSMCGSDLAYTSAQFTLSATEPASLYYRLKYLLNGTFGAWQTYGGPVTLSAAGVHLIEYYASDTAGNVELTRTAQINLRAAFPSAGVLDTFNRADGVINSRTTTWQGDVGGYAIRNRQVQVFGGGAIYWRTGAALGVNQEAFVTLTNVDAQGHEQDLLLKVQGGNTPDWRRGAIEVLLDTEDGVIRVETFRPGQSAWTLYPDIPVAYQNGDRLGGQALANGDVLIYRNCVLLARQSLNAADQAFFNPRGGRIGLWFIRAPNARLDDFGGGNLTP